MIYSKKLNSGNTTWFKSFQQFEGISGFEPMYQDDIDSGVMSEYEAFSANVQWIYDVAATCSNIDTPDDEEFL